MILGIGTDIVAIHRIRDLHTRYGGKLAARLLAPGEWSDYIEARNQDRFLAKRFAAKEAFAKAVGTGMRTPVSFSNLGVSHDDLGRPSFDCTPELLVWLEARGAGALHLTLSDEQDYAVAFVVIETA